MVYLIALGERVLKQNESDWRDKQRFTKVVPSELIRSDRPAPLAFVVAPPSSQSPRRRSRSLDWVGTVARMNTPGSVDRSITIDPFRECNELVELDGPEGVLAHMPESHREAFEAALPAEGGVDICAPEAWQAFLDVLHERHPRFGELVKWLLAQAEAPHLDSADPADRAWQEQQDAVRTILRLADLPTSPFAAWGRPDDRNAPYLRGLIPEPVENSLIEHDVRAGVSSDFLGDWQQQSDLACDIHVLQDSDGRRIEVANVNATPVESRLGTDLIYYHHPTHSFVFVQYKRLHERSRKIHVDSRLLSQMNRLQQVADQSRKDARSPGEWRLAGDSCFLKFAYWPIGGVRPQELAPGMYLPLSYAWLLLDDPCTRGPRGGRILGYEQVERHLTSTQFSELVKHGLAGTVGTSIEDLRKLGRERAVEGHSVVVAVESSRESPKDRQRRVRRRGARKRIQHIAGQKTPAVDSPEPDA